MGGNITLLLQIIEFLTTELKKVYVFNPTNKIALSKPGSVIAYAKINMLQVSSLFGAIVLIILELYILSMIRNQITKHCRLETLDILKLPLGISIVLLNKQMQVYIPIF